MVKLFFIIIALLCPGLVLADDLEKAPDGFEKIAAELNAKKQELEPFDRKKLKVDLESLGLDDVDKNDETKKTAELDNKPKEEIKAESTVTANSDAGQKTILIDPKAATAEIKSQDLTPPVNNAAAQNIAPLPDMAAKPNVAQKPVKASPPKRLSYKKAKKIAAPNEKIQTAKSQELNDLRKKYLAKFNENGDEVIVEEDSELIVPRRKEVSKFIVDETPPPPILNRFRTKENAHIPTISSKQEMNELLFSTVASGNISLFSDAFKDIENPNAANKNGDTLLTFSTLLQKYSIMATLIDKGADPNMPNKLGYSPLDIAIELLDSKSFEILFRGGADINYVDGLGRTYLIHAAKVGFLPGVISLVENGVDINAMDKDGFTALAMAYRYKRDVIVKYLLRHNAKTWIEKPYDPGSQSLIRELESRWK